MTSALLASGIEVAGWYGEGGVRQYEVALLPADPTTAADRALLARHAIEEVAAGAGLRASFSPKPGPGFGSGLHVHVSVHDAAGSNLFHRLGAGGPAGGGHALAGVLAVLRPATALFSPTPEAYLRLEPHAAAGTTATWAHDNRGAGVRHLDRAEDSRLELRCAAGDANPYLVVAAVLAGLEHGLAGRLPLPPAVAGDVYRNAPAATSLPGDLLAAAGLLQHDPVLNRVLGARFVAHYAATRLWAARAAGGA